MAYLDIRLRYWKGCFVEAYENDQRTDELEVETFLDNDTDSV